MNRACVTVHQAVSALLSITFISKEGNVGDEREVDEVRSRARVDAEQMGLRPLRA